MIQKQLSMRSLVLIAVALFAILASAESVVEYDAASLAAAREAGRVLVKFYAPWWYGRPSMIESERFSVVDIVRTWRQHSRLLPRSSQGRLRLAKSIVTSTRLYGILMIISHPQLALP